MAHTARAARMAAAVARLTCRPGGCGTCWTSSSILPVWEMSNCTACWWFAKRTLWLLTSRILSPRRSLPVASAAPPLVIWWAIIGIISKGMRSYNILSTAGGTQQPPKLTALECGHVLQHSDYYLPHIYGRKVAWAQTLHFAGEEFTFEI